MKRLKLIAISTVAAAVLSGCSGVDEDRLAELTGNKNFQQVKQSYISARALDKTENVKIYKYLLEKNGEKAQATFNFKMFEKQLDQQFLKQKDIYEKKMNLITKQNNDLIARSKSKGFDIQYKYIHNLKKELKQTHILSTGSYYLKTVYIPFLGSEISKLKEQRKIKRNEEEAERRAKSGDILAKRKAYQKKLFEMKKAAENQNK